MLALYFVLGIAAVLLALYLYLIYPGRRRDTSPFQNLQYAHRGLHSGNSLVPENSLAAFRRAREAGYAVELDVQFTADRQVVVFHDSTLKRMCGVDSRVDALTYAQLQQYTLLGSDQRIPLLSEVLEVLEDTPVLCEFKSQRSFTDTSLCAAAWPLLQAHKGPVCIESFNPLMVRWFRQNQPQVIRGILSMKFGKSPKEVTPLQGYLLTALLTNFLTKPDFIAYQHTDSHLFPFRVCRYLFRATTIAWTIRNPEEQAAAGADFDTFIFEGYLPVSNVEKTFLKKV